jgi:hypothetical protein
MNRFVILLLLAVLIVALVLGMTLSGCVQEGIVTDRLTSVIAILKMTSVTPEQQYDMIKTIGIVDSKYANIINNRSLSKADAITKLKKVITDNGIQL